MTTCRVCELHPAVLGADVCMSCWRCWTRTMSDGATVMSAVLRSAAVIVPIATIKRVETERSVDRALDRLAAKIAEGNTARMPAPEPEPELAIAPEEEVLAHLAVVASEVAPAPAIASSVPATPTSKHRCGECLAPGHNARTCPKVTKPTPAPKRVLVTKPLPPPAPPMPKSSRMAAIAEIEEERRREKREQLRAGRGAFGLAATRTIDDEDEDDDRPRDRPYSPGMSTDTHTTISITDKFTAED